MGASEVTKSLGEALASHWRVAEASLRSTAELYNGFYAAEIERCGAVTEQANDS
jgi:hypothetical protein